MKLLLVGDERKNRRMFAWGFSSEPYRVKMANSRASVSQLLDADSFQAACVDLKMQEDNGISIVAYLHNRLPGLPIVALGGDKDRKLLAELKEHGVCAHLSVPFAIETLHAAVKMHALNEPLTGAKKEKVKEPPAPPPPPTRTTGLSDETSRRIPTRPS
jgi:DNA-binding NtrC family response regulator